MTNNTVTVLAVRAAAGGARVQIDIERQPTGEKETLSLLTVYLEKMPQRGLLSPDAADLLLELAALSAATDAAMRLLSSSGASKRRLIQKLRMRGFSSTVARRTAEELAARGYLREEEGALREAERGVAKLWGDRRILQSLVAKGYSSDALVPVTVYLRGENATERCARYLVRKRFTLSDDPKQNAALIASCVRYGYTPAEVRAAVRKIQEE